MLTYKFRLYPNKEQIEKLEFTLDICRQTYNTMLGELNNQIVIDKAQIQAMLPDMKICEPKFKQVYSKTLQYECYRLFSNLSALRVLKGNHKKVGRLRFKGKNWFNTIHFNQSGFKLLPKNKKKGNLQLSKIGDIDIRTHRKVEGNIKQIIIKKSADKWWACIQTDANKQITHGDKIKGYDLGIVHYLTDNDGNTIEHPMNLQKNEKKLKKAHQNLSRKKKGSNRRKKAILRLQRNYENITNSRNDFLHRTTTNIIKDCKIVAIEDLDIKRMMITSYNAKNIADSSWGRWTQMLLSKAESAGCEVVKVAPEFTTLDCSSCGRRKKKMPLSQRTYKCSKCGLVIDRDHNSAINILKRYYLNKYNRFGANLLRAETSTPLEQVSAMKREAPLLK